VVKFAFCRSIQFTRVLLYLVRLLLFSESFKSNLLEALDFLNHKWVEPRGPALTRRQSPKQPLDTED